VTDITVAEAKEDRGYSLVLHIRAEVSLLQSQREPENVGECKQGVLLPAPDLLRDKHHLGEYPRETGLRGFQSREGYREQGIKLPESWTSPSYNV